MLFYHLGKTKPWPSLGILCFWTLDNLMLQGNILECYGIRKNTIN